MFLSSIPSPDFNSFDIGPLTVRIYGLAIAAGVLTAVWLARRRYAKAGGDPEFLDRVAIWVVLAGIVGARVGFVLPRMERFSDNPVEMFEVWEGGLTFFGGLLGGVVAGVILVVRNRAPLGMLLTAVAPAIPLAQAIGRLGNYFNQELYGRPTDLPWGLEIDENAPGATGPRMPGYEQYSTFHPTFLYEIIWNLALVGLLLWLGAKKKLRPGSLALIYMIGYGVGRFLTELIRIDTEARILGLSRNAYNSILIVILGAALLWWREGRKGGPEDTYLGDDEDSGSDEGAADEEASEAEGPDSDDDEPETADADGRDDADGSEDEAEDADEPVTADAEDDPDVDDDTAEESDESVEPVTAEDSDGRSGEDADGSETADADDADDSDDDSDASETAEETKAT